jgi:hypothetical protein
MLDWDWALKPTPRSDLCTFLRMMHVRQQITDYGEGRGKGRWPGKV